MEQLDYLWDYQKLDLKMDNLESKKKNSTARKELYRAIRYLKDQQDSLIKLNNDVDKKNHIYNRIYHEFERINSGLREEEDALNSENIKSFKQLDQIEKKISEAEERLNKRKQELNNLLRDMDSLNKKLHAVSLRLRKGKKEYEKTKEEYDLVMNEIDTQYARIKDQRDSLKQKLEDSLLRKYDAIKGNHAIVMAEIEQNRCGGCNMTLASLVVQNVRDKVEVIECENCGRILYPGASISAS